MKEEKAVGFRDIARTKNVVICDKYGLFWSNKYDREQICYMINLGYIIFFESFGKRIWIKLENEKWKKNLI